MPYYTVERGFSVLGIEITGRLGETIPIRGEREWNKLNLLGEQINEHIRVGAEGRLAYIQKVYDALRDAEDPPRTEYFDPESVNNSFLNRRVRFYPDNDLRGRRFFFNKLLPKLPNLVGLI